MKSVIAKDQRGWPGRDLSLPRSGHVIRCFELMHTPSRIGYLLIALLLLILAAGWWRSEGQLAALPNLENYPWAFLRHGLLLGKDEDTISVLIVGDVMPGRGVSETSNPFGSAAGLLQAADLTMGNLEAVLVGEEVSSQNSGGEMQPILLSASPGASIALKQAGFDILGLANNHILDFGYSGMKETADHLRRSGINSIGSISEDGFSAPLFLTIRGVRLAFLAFNAVPDPDHKETCQPAEFCLARPASWDPQRASTAIKLAKSTADAVIVSMHWGYEYETRPDPFQENAASIIMEAGADLIVGHHPHVVQPITVKDAQVTAYSLGNFLFDQGFEQTSQGLALLAFFDRGGLRAVQVLPLQVGTSPHLLPLVQGKALLDRVLPMPPRVGFSCDTNGCNPVQIPMIRSNSRLYAGKADLTGDGIDETIRHEAEQITIYEGGTVVWQSPQAWQVVDAALGDPNDDGRSEIMLAIWQRDQAGFERSQPYVVGHRGGEYRLLWGGRPVVDPIVEIDVGDVDGDGSDELVVIEELADGSERALSVWKWGGWTFSLFWRSQYGSYRDLILVEEGQVLIGAVLDVK